MTRELRPDELRAVCDPATLPFDSIAELAPLDRMIGQDAAWVPNVDRLKRLRGN